MNNSNVLGYIKIAFLVMGGALGNILGGWDVALQVLIYFTVFDIITGILASAYLRKLASSVGYKGLIKKVSIYVMIAIAYQLDLLLGTSLMLRMAMIFFYIAIEGISILENLSKTELPIPSFIKNLLAQMQEAADKGDVTEGETDA